MVKWENIKMYCIAIDCGYFIKREISAVYQFNHMATTSEPDDVIIANFFQVHEVTKKFAKRWLICQRIVDREIRMANPEPLVERRFKRADLELTREGIYDTIDAIKADGDIETLASEYGMGHSHFIEVMMNEYERY
ncbi:MAG: hypothetical protein DRJ03_07985 [Chloroflexi bacterium]|nr:MAG: hypothetical protein DRJ03_07985 [Chloroflexota bacterium]